MPRCSSCNAPIEWATSAATGKAMPIDAEPVDDGNIVLRDGQAVVLGRWGGDDLPPGTPRFKSHFATCRFAGRHRRAKEPARG